MSTFVFGQAGVDDTAIEEHRQHARFGWHWWVDQVDDHGRGERYRVAEGWCLTESRAHAVARHIAREECR